MISQQSFQISRHRIGPGGDGRGRCFLIAEAGVNHNGDPALAHRLIDVAADAGADAVKFQTFRSEQLISVGAPKAAYQRKATGSSESQLEMIKELELSFDDFAALQDHCTQRGLVFLSTPFDHDSVAFLDRLPVPAIKVPSGEITNFPLLAHIARCTKPVILSTGMATLQEVAEALDVLGPAEDQGIAILHCVSSYPTDPADANLNAMETMRVAFGHPVGWSDHTTGCDIAFAAVALGAAVVEKHFTLDTSLPGPDHRASLDPRQLTELVRGMRRVEAALGDGEKRPRPCEADTRDVARRSLFLCHDLAAGSTITAGTLSALRPAGGIGPNELEQVLGRKAARSLKAGDMIAWADLV